MEHPISSRPADTPLDRRAIPPASRHAASRALWFVVVVSLVPISALDSAELDTGLEHWAEGRFNQARTQVMAVYRDDASDPMTKAAYASFLYEGKEAQVLFRHITADTAAPDSVRAFAFERLGDLAYAQGDYAEAAGHYRRAVDLVDIPSNTFRLAVALWRDKKHALALSLLKAAAFEGSGPAAAQAYYHLGNIYREEKDFAKALDCYDEACESGPETPWHVPALAGRAVCAVKTGFGDRGSEFARELAEDYPGYLERRLVADMMPRTESPSQGTFTIQVGSFGNRDNAGKLRDRLGKYFDDVNIVVAEVKGRMFYRVRIGSFPSRKQAERFARRKLKKRRISYKVLGQ